MELWQGEARGGGAERVEVRRHLPLAVVLRHARGARAAAAGLGRGAAGGAVALDLRLALARLACRGVAVELVD